jgi:multidrug efflux system membrane fusion protein
VIFTIPEDSIPTVLEQLGRGVRLPVQAYDREQRK